MPGGVAGCGDQARPLSSVIMRLLLLLVLAVSVRAATPDELLARLAGHHAYTAGHAGRVGTYAAYLAGRLKLAPEEVERCRLAGRLHDLGKTDVPAAILDKPGKLTAAEWAVIKRHPLRGAELARGAGVHEEVAQGIQGHHERPDGTGYPLGLKDIPRIARIVAVADTFDAVTSKRSYQPARPFGDAAVVLRKAAGTQLDRAFVELFLADEKSLRALMPD